MLLLILTEEKEFKKTPFETLLNPKAIKIIIPVAVMVIMSRAFPLFNIVYYLVPLFFLYFFFTGISFAFRNNFLKTFLLLILAFGIWASLTSAWSDYPWVSISRSGYFMFISFAAVLGGYLWQQINSGSLSFLLPANIVIISLSLFSLITNIPAESWTGGNGKGFMGFAGHQNTLASAILFTLPGLITRNSKFKIQNQQSKKSAARILFLYIFIILNILILLLTFSRASLLAFICGTIIFLIFNKKWNTLIYSTAAILLIFCLVWFSPSIKTEFNKFIRKDFPAFYSTREWMWVPSYKAALNGGLAGIGYGISNPDIIVPGTGSYYDNGRYIREKGNSFLALVEEVGVVGFMLFLLPLGYLLKMFNKNKAVHPSTIFHQPSSIVISVLVALLIHSQFEAWMVGVGSIQLPIFFFYLGSFINLPLEDSSV